MSYTIILLVILFLIPRSYSDDNNTNSIYKNEYGQAYGKEWILISDNNNELHYVNLIRNIPALRGFLSDVSFSLYTRKNSNFIESLNHLLEHANNIEGSSPSSVFFDRSKPVKLITHGWMSSEHSDTVINIKDAYLKKYDANVIAVDWSESAKNYLYPAAAYDTRHVGKHVADFIDILVELFEITGKQIHLIGHSLGAHIMGIAAKNSREKIYRVTGLDPARPLFEVPQAEDYLRLTPNDAEFVDIIHTCAGYLGFSEPLGHVDFYPNGGVPGQPGCHGFQAIIESCSHGRAHKYFADSINRPERYVSYNCQSWDYFTKGRCGGGAVSRTAYMGEAADPGSKGTYYLYTNAPPSV